MLLHRIFGNAADDSHLLLLLRMAQKIEFRRSGCEICVPAVEEYGRGVVVNLNLAVLSARGSHFSMPAAMNAAPSTFTMRRAQV